MSNSTRPGGYDERLVVPLEASRRGAHRARVNPLVAALPLLAVVVVVAAVIGVAYTLFLKPSGTSDEGPTTLPTTTAPAAGGSSPTAPATGASSPSVSSSSSPRATTTPKVDKTTAFSVYNGSTPAVNGLGGKAATALQNAGWSGARLVKTPAPVQTTTTVVYYGHARQAGTAEALAKELHGTAKLKGSIAGDGIVVVIGNDYAA